MKIMKFNAIKQHLAEAIGPVEIMMIFAFIYFYSFVFVVALAWENSSRQSNPSRYYECENCIYGTLP